MECEQNDGQAKESCDDVESERDGDDGKEKLSMANFIKWITHVYCTGLEIHAIARRMRPRMLINSHAASGI